VRYARGSKPAGIEPGSYGTVAGINVSENPLTIQKPAGETVTYDPRRLLGVSVHLSLNTNSLLAIASSSPRPINPLALRTVILPSSNSMGPDGRVVPRLDDDRRVEYVAVEHRHFDHGYAGTSHSAQGLTAERVLYADTSVHPELLNSRFGYVSVSRPSHEAIIFTNDNARLKNQHLDAEVTKTTALQIGDPSNKIGGIGMSI
jgi:hypothetical protein